VVGLFRRSLEAGLVIQMVFIEGGLVIQAVFRGWSGYTDGLWWVVWLYRRSIEGGLVIQAVFRG
jgi:hypothetical protein